jgi:sulfatase maturation enzyme AslB (radical SAM superfamily)
MVINDDSQVTAFDNLTIPDSWHIVVGNICNLACWHCGEEYSSTIAQHKRQLKILNKDFIDPTVEFHNRWPDIKQNILNSYKFYDIVTITLLGGEPMYNKLAIEFVTELVNSGLSKRTNIEITTNGTKLGSKMLKVLHKDSWRHISVFVSVDAIGSKSEWLRYGSNWNEVSTNIKHYADTVTRLELHYTVSILNINNLLEFINFCLENQYRYNIIPLAEPWFMDIRHWDNTTDFINTKNISNQQTQELVNLVGTTPTNGASAELSKYIKQFDTIRTPLRHYDPVLAQVLDL